MGDAYGRDKPLTAADHLRAHAAWVRGQQWNLLDPDLLEDIADGLDEAHAEKDKG